MKKTTLLKMMLLAIWIVGSFSVFGQTTISSDGLNNSSTVFTVSGGAYYTGNSATGDRPASSPFASEGTHAYGVSNATATLTSSDINTSGYNASLSLRLAAFSIGSTANGVDGPDVVTVEISPNGGTTYYSTLKVAGNSNAYWAYSATGSASTTYDGDATAVNFAPTAGGSRTTDGYSTITITNLPQSTNMRVRITMVNNDTKERWVVDDFKVTGSLITTPSLVVSPLTLTGFSYIEGSGPSTEKTFTVSGSNLTTDVSLTAPANYEISTTSGSGFGGSLTLTQSGGSVASTTIHVRLKAGLTAGNYNSENITVASTGATSQNVACSGTVVVPTLTTSVTTLTGFTYIQGGGPSTEKTFTVSGTNLTADISLTAPTDYEISKTTTNGFGSSLTLTPSSNSVATTTIYVRLKAGLTEGTYNSEDISISSTNATTKTVTCSGTVTAPVITISASPTTVPEIKTTVNVSKTETVTVTSTNVTGDITPVLSGTGAAMFSVSPATLPSTGGSLTITYTPTALGSHTATLTLSATGATDVTRSLTGSATLATPVANAATAVSQTGFTANWGAVAGADTYDISVYTKSGSTVLEEFNGGSATPPTGWTFTSIAEYTSTGYYGTNSPSMKFDALNDQIVTHTYSTAAKEISFWLRGAGTDAISALLVEGFDGASWSTIENIKPLPTAGTVKTYNASSTPALASGLTQFRFTYTKSNGNLAFDDFTWSDLAKTQVSGSPFTGLTTTSKTVTGLSNVNTYYYTLVAKSGAVTSSTSNEITVNLLVTGLNNKNVDNKLNVYGLNGAIHFSAVAGEKVEVFNATGQKMMSTVANEGVNTLSVNAKGVVIVKVGDRTGKVIL